MSKPLPTPTMLSAPIVPLDEVALIDEAAELLDQDIGDLMEQAGAAVASQALSMAPKGPILVVCGGGNNGGDGYVAARLLLQAEREVLLWPVLEPASDLCRKQEAQLRSMSGCIWLNAGPKRVPGLIIDAILGAGVRGLPRHPIPQVLEELAGLGAPALAVDAPTGLGTPLILPDCQALCFQVAKQEVIAALGQEAVQVVDIGIEEAAVQDVNLTCLRRLPALRRDSHKGQHGELLCIGGSQFPGAIALATQAALRSGCDLIRAWTLSRTRLPDSIIHQMRPGDSLGPADPETLTPLLARAGAVLIGPGLGTAPRAAELTRQTWSLAIEMGVPVVVDADAIFLLGEELRKHHHQTTPVIITPHQAEARNLMQGKVDERIIHSFARPERTILAKGRCDFISDGQQWQYNHHGNPRLTMGGTGDILAGLCAGLLARGARPFDAARMAVFWLCTTGDELWRSHGPCYTPEDILDALSWVLRRHLIEINWWPPVQHD